MPSSSASRCPAITRPSFHKLPSINQPGSTSRPTSATRSITYVRSLPRPIERKPTSDGEAKHLAAGRAVFSTIGCASCHAPKLGNVDGIYSDLLLHDMGQDMAQSGSYGAFFDDSSDEPLVPPVGPGVTQNRASEPGPTRTRMGATRREWRTPPLWGFRDSGLYLHDGQAQTLDQAVAMHGGQGADAARRYFRLSPGQRLQVEAFLKSLLAPAPVQLAHAAD